MLNETMARAFNGQLNAEFYSSYLYLSMSAWLEDANLPGFANWMKVQFQEEQFHTGKFFNFICERGSRVNLTAIEAPPTDWKSPLDVFEATLAHEQKVTGLINDLVYLARDEKDNASEIFLQWFVSEQVEEEKNAADLIGKLKLIEGSPQALFMLDQDLAQRVFMPPVANGGAQ